MLNEHFHYNSHSWLFSCELLLLSSKEPASMLIVILVPFLLQGRGKVLEKS